jgi:plastocyanin
VLYLASATLGTILLLPSGPATAQPTKPAKRAEIDGTPQFKWQPASVTIAPGGTVTFKIVGLTPHPVGSGSAPPNDDGIIARRHGRLLLAGGDAAGRLAGWPPGRDQA